MYMSRSVSVLCWFQRCVMIEHAMCGLCRAMLQQEVRDADAQLEAGGWPGLYPNFMTRGYIPLITH